MFVLKKTYKEVRDWNNELQAGYYNLLSHIEELEHALQRIREQQTKGANATVKRMVRIAEEALGVADEESTPSD